MPPLAEASLEEHLKICYDQRLPSISMFIVVRNESVEEMWPLARKFESKVQYRGRRRRPEQKATIEECEPLASRANQGSKDTKARGNLDKINAAIKLIRTFEKKI